MSDLSNTEKHNLEKLFVMSGGCILNFSNRTFDDFVHDSTGRNIYDAKHESGSGSKANRRRAFRAVAPNNVVAMLLRELLAYNSEIGVNTDLQSEFEVCQRTALRLGQSASVAEIEAITPNSFERDFAALAKQVHEAIDKNEPESGRDRLYMFAILERREIVEEVAGRKRGRFLGYRDDLAILRDGTEPVSLIG